MNNTITIQHNATQKEGYKYFKTYSSGSDSEVGVKGGSCLWGGADNQLWFCSGGEVFGVGGTTGVNLRSPSCPLVLGKTVFC